MADMLRDGAKHLSDTLNLVASQNVTLTRGEDSHQITATIGRSTFETQSADGFVESWESRDYIVRAADFPFAEPQRGDTITELVDGRTVVYEVTAPPGTPLFHYSDSFQHSLRVHTVRFSE